MPASMAALSCHRGEAAEKICRSAALIRKDNDALNAMAVKLLEQTARGNVLDVIRGQGISADRIYACGPKPMLHFLAAWAEENGIPCFVSMEERMACGIGACLACVCRTKETDSHTNVRNRRVCKEGPVFRSTEVEI